MHVLSSSTAPQLLFPEFEKVPTQHKQQHNNWVQRLIALKYTEPPPRGVIDSSMSERVTNQATPPPSVLETLRVVVLRGRRPNSQMGCALQPRITRSIDRTVSQADDVLNVPFALAPLYEFNHQVQ